MHKTAAVGMILLALAACGTPQERCIDRSTREVRNLQSLSASVDGNLARGYAVEEENLPVSSWEVCGYDTFEGRNGRVISRPRMCLQEDYITRYRQVPIDPQAETRKRTLLQDKIKGLVPQMNASIAACKATYPE